MNSLVKVPPYSKLNFQGKDFFTQNWCNITLNNPLKWNSRKLIVIICKRKKIQEKNVYLNDQWKGHNKCEMMFLIQILLQKVFMKNKLQCVLLIMLEIHQRGKRNVSMMSCGIRWRNIMVIQENEYHKIQRSIFSMVCIYGLLQ